MSSGPFVAPAMPGMWGLNTSMPGATPVTSQSMPHATTTDAPDPSIMSANHTELEEADGVPGSAMPSCLQSSNLPILNGAVPFDPNTFATVMQGTAKSGLPLGAPLGMVPPATTTQGLSRVFAGIPPMSPQVSVPSDVMQNLTMTIPTAEALDCDSLDMPTKEEEAVMPSDGAEDPQAKRQRVGGGGVEGVELPVAPPPPSLPPDAG